MPENIYARVRAACLAALGKARDGVRRHAEQFNWPAATRQFEQALVRLSAQPGATPTRSESMA